MNPLTQSARRPPDTAQQRGGRAFAIARWILAGLLLLAVALPHLFALSGHRLISIDGGSMVPTYLPGDILVTDPPTGDDLHLGNIVVIGDPGRLYTHRVIDTRDAAAGTRARLQGDANATPDPGWITQADVYARPALHVTGIPATAITVVTGPLGAGVLILAAAGLVLFPRRNRPRADRLPE